jgi:hypothetical protein
MGNPTITPIQTLENSSNKDNNKEKNRSNMSNSNNTSIEQIRKIVKESSEPLTFDLSILLILYTLKNPKRNWKDICAIIVIYVWVIPMTIVFGLSLLFGGFVPESSSPTLSTASNSGELLREGIKEIGMRQVSGVGKDKREQEIIKQRFIEVVNKKR